MATPQGLRNALRSPLGISAAVLLVLVLGLAVVGPIVWHGPATTPHPADLNQKGSGAHWLGTDALGRDVFARVLVATRLSVELALLATVFGTVGGVALGALPTALGRRAGRLVSGLIDLLVAFPGLLLAMFLAAVFGVGARGALLALSVAMIPSTARLTHTLSAGVAESDYVAAARNLGVRRGRLIRRHVLPNIAEPLVITTATTIGGMLLAFAGLSYLGFGVQAPSYDWGRLLNEGLAGIYVNPVAAVGPGAAVVIAGIAFNLLGEVVARAVGAPSTSRLAGRLRGRRSRPGGAAAGDAALDTVALRVEELTVRFGAATPVNGVALTLAPGELVGIVGESGSGKSLTAMGIADLLPPTATVAVSRLSVDGRDAATTPGREWQHWLGTRLGLVFQNPMTALNPTMQVGRQVAEVAQVHGGEQRKAAFGLAVDRMRAVRIPAAERRARQRPHELSGGMRQRAVIAMGLMGSPSVVIADEPTTALDVTVQGQVLDVLRLVRERTDAAIALISHDIAVVAGFASRVVVMYAGRIVEDLPVETLLNDPAHPYTVALLAAVPHMDVDPDAPMRTIPGRPAAPSDAITGCPFAPRCEFAEARCWEVEPPLETWPDGRRVACWNPRAKYGGRALSVAGAVE